MRALAAAEAATAIAAAADVASRMLLPRRGDEGGGGGAPALSSDRPGVPCTLHGALEAASRLVAEPDYLDAAQR